MSALCRGKFQAVKQGFGTMPSGARSPSEYSPVVWHAPWVSLSLGSRGQGPTPGAHYPPQFTATLLWRRQILRRLWVKQISCHSADTFSSPRNRNLRIPRADLVMPNTGSTICFRAAVVAAAVAIAHVARLAIGIQASVPSIRISVNQRAADITNPSHLAALHGDHLASHEIVAGVVIHRIGFEQPAVGHFADSDAFSSERARYVIAHQAIDNEHFAYSARRLQALQQRPFYRKVIQIKR